MSRKRDRIDFYNMLVHSSENTFDEWCSEITSEAEYLEKRSFLLLEFYSAFKKIYDYFCHCFIKNDIRKIYCEFSKDNSSMEITVKFNDYKVNLDDSFTKELLGEFYPFPGDDYDDFEIELKPGNDKSLKLIFLKG